MEFEIIDSVYIDSKRWPGANLLFRICGDDMSRSDTAIQLAILQSSIAFIAKRASIRMERCRKGSPKWPKIMSPDDRHPTFLS